MSKSSLKISLEELDKFFQRDNFNVTIEEENQLIGWLNQSKRDLFEVLRVVMRHNEIMVSMLADTTLVSDRLIAYIIRLFGLHFDHNSINLIHPSLIDQILKPLTDEKSTSVLSRVPQIRPSLFTFPLKFMGTIKGWLGLFGVHMKYLIAKEENTNNVVKELSKSLLLLCQQARQNLQLTNVHDTILPCLLHLLNLPPLVDQLLNTPQFRHFLRSLIDRSFRCEATRELFDRIFFELCRVRNSPCVPKQDWIYPSSLFQRKPRLESQINMDFSLVRMFRFTRNIDFSHRLSNLQFVNKDIICKYSHFYPLILELQLEKQLVDTQNMGLLLQILTTLRWCQDDYLSRKPLVNWKVLRICTMGEEYFKQLETVKFAIAFNKTFRTFD
ncbi:hypothetical protein Ciccas_000737 [Cichlidogyrus casuarinus]|uniref:Uncharacterized protein n=1 Tax=Cichlidogyrus casuarinus TaxID=1844966 RepID=A0ABD2QPZ5_9PLAT